MLQQFVDLLNPVEEPVPAPNGLPFVEDESSGLKVTVDTGLTSYEIPVTQPRSQIVLDGYLANVLPESDGTDRDYEVQRSVRIKRDSSSRDVLDTHQPAKRSSKYTSSRTDTKETREREQRVNRDKFRKRVLALANTWIGCCENGDRLKHGIVVNEDSCKPKKQNNHNGDIENTTDNLTKKQNGYYFYHILYTKEIGSLVALNRPKLDGESDMDVLVDHLAFVADIFLRVMFNNNTRSSVFIKFDDTNVPALFARQMKQMVDTCITGPPGRYFTKILHLDNVMKMSQHITLQRVVFGRLMQDCTFVVVGGGGVLEQIYSVTPEHFVSPSQSRRCYKGLYNFINAIPENDLACLGWELIDKTGVSDPIKTFLPKVVAADRRAADDVCFINYVDMFVTMLVHRHTMENRLTLYDEESFRFYYKPPAQPKVYRTEYKYELAGKAEHPGLYYYRNREDFVTDLCMVNTADNLYSGGENLERMLTDGEDDGIYFYDIQLVNDVLFKLKNKGVAGVVPQQGDFYLYILSECDDVQEMIAYSNHTIQLKLADVVRENTFWRLHETDPARRNPKQCLEHQDDIVVKCNFGEYKSTYYIDKTLSLKRVFGWTPENLDVSDCVLRSYRLKWTRKDTYVMFPVFSVVFKNFSRFQETIPAPFATTLPVGDFVFPGQRDSNVVSPAGTRRSCENANHSTTVRILPADSDWGSEPQKVGVSDDKKRDTLSSPVAVAVGNDREQTATEHPIDVGSPFTNFGREARPTEVGVGVQLKDDRTGPATAGATYDTSSLLDAGFSIPDFKAASPFTIADLSSGSRGHVLTYNQSERASCDKTECRELITFNVIEPQTSLSYTPLPLEPRTSPSYTQPLRGLRISPLYKPPLFEPRTSPSYTPPLPAPCDRHDSESDDHS